MAGNRNLEGKLAIVTGQRCSRGIGKAISENLASKGCNLVLNYTSASSESRTAELATQLQKEHNVKAAPFRADMGDPQGPIALVGFTRETFMHPKSGNVQIDIIINNAGVAGNAHLATNTAEKIQEDFHKQYSINVLGPLLLVQAAIPFLPTDRSGRIVNVSSVSSSLGLEGQSVYGGTKAALEAMTRTWSRELKDRATVNAINPGPVVTDMYGGTEAWFQRQMRPWNEVAPRAQVKKGWDDEETLNEALSGGPDGTGTGGRGAAPAEIAGIVAMLCSSESTWCTGSVICANGGMRFSP